MRYIAAFAAMSCLSVTAFAQTGPELVIDQMTDTTVAGSLFYGAEHNAGTNQSGHDINVSRAETDFRLKLDPYAAPASADTQPAPKVGWMIANIRAGYSHTWLHLDTTYPGLPKNLQDQSFGVAFVFYRDTEWTLSAGAAIGYAGNNLYADESASYAKIDLMASHPLDERSQLQIFLSYDGNRTFLPDIPMPGIAYVRQHNEQLKYMIGLPVSMIEYKPVQELTLRASYLLVDNFTLSARYDLTKQVAFLLDYRSKADAFQYRDEGNDRLFFEQKTIEAAVEYTPIKNLTLTAAAGFAFDQRFTTGYDMQDTDTITKISDEPYVRIGASFRF